MDFAVEQGGAAEVQRVLELMDAVPDGSDVTPPLRLKDTPLAMPFGMDIFRQIEEHGFVSGLSWVEAQYLLRRLQEREMIRGPAQLPAMRKAFAINGNEEEGWVEAAPGPDLADLVDYYEGKRRQIALRTRVKYREELTQGPLVFVPSGRDRERVFFLPNPEPVVGTVDNSIRVKFNGIEQDRYGNPQGRNGTVIETVGGAVYGMAVAAGMNGTRSGIAPLDYVRVDTPGLYCPVYGAEIQRGGTLTRSLSFVPVTARSSVPLVRVQFGSG